MYKRRKAQIKWIIFGIFDVKQCVFLMYFAQLSSYLAIHYVFYFQDIELNTEIDHWSLVNQHTIFKNDFKFLLKND